MTAPEGVRELLVGRSSGRAHQERIVWRVVFPEGEESADVLLQDKDCLALLGVVLALGLLLLGLAEEGALFIGIEHSEFRHDV